MSVTRTDLTKNLACFTIAQDESDGLRLWLAHYKQYAPAAAKYVLDHDSQGSFRQDLYKMAEKYEAIVVPVHHGTSFDYRWLTRTVQDFMQFLLHSYRYVCFSEVDELVWPVNGTLDEFVSEAKTDVFRAQGYGVVHDYPAEPDIDWSRPLLQQRQHWYATAKYSKVCLSNRPVFFKYGFHGCYNVPADLAANADLLLLHLHQVDFKTTLRRHQNNAGKFWSPEFRLHPLALHQRLDNPGDLQRYLLCDLDNPEVYAKLIKIPTAYKESYAACLSIA